jgi:hypothetical protein
MMRLEASTDADLTLIESWCKQDIDSTHHNLDPHFFLTGQGFLTLKVVDDIGPVFFARFDECRERLVNGLRFHTQFAPVSEVSKKRVSAAIDQTLMAFIEKVKADGINFLMFETVFPELAAFMQLTFGFRQVEGTNDYILNLTPNPVVKVCPDCEELIVEGKAFHLAGCQVASETAAPTVQPVLA